MRRISVTSLLVLLTVLTTGPATAGCALSPKPLVQDFRLGPLDPCTWKIVEETWGGLDAPEGHNGGVVGANVEVRDGVVALVARGDRYSGAVRGVAAGGRPRVDGRRTGAAIMTHGPYLGGRFEAEVRVIREPGVVSALWVYAANGRPGGIADDTNHEIDIEFPGQWDPGAPPSPDHVSLTTWTGLAPGRSSSVSCALTSTADGYRHLRFDWWPPSAGRAGAVAFYVDGVLLHVATKNVPGAPANLWLGAWFPHLWAGDPAFAEAAMPVRGVRVTELDTPAPSAPLVHASCRVARA